MRSLNEAGTLSSRGMGAPKDEEKEGRDWSRLVGSPARGEAGAKEKHLTTGKANEQKKRLDLKDPRNPEETGLKREHVRTATRRNQHQACSS